MIIAIPRGAEQYPGVFFRFADPRARPDPETDGVGRAKKRCCERAWTPEAPGVPDVVFPGARSYMTPGVFFPRGPEPPSGGREKLNDGAVPGILELHKEF